MPIFAVIEPSDHAVLALLALVALGFVLAVAEKVVTIARSMRKTPPDHEVYATKGEMHDLENRISGEITSLRSSLGNRLDTIDKTLSAELRAINRSLGRLEGKGTD
jgi:sialic acid synthase SpsE